MVICYRERIDDETFERVSTFIKEKLGDQRVLILDGVTGIAVAKDVR